MRNDAPPGLQSFVGLGLLIVAWRTAPGPHSDPMLYVFSGAFAFFGATALITGMTRANASPSPLPGLAGRVIWALRPRSWMIAWAIIYVAASIFGTPHLAFNYPPRTHAGVCEYVGWLGVVRLTGEGDELLNGCRIMALVRDQNR